MSNLERFIGECWEVPEVEDCSQLLLSLNKLINFLREPATFPNLNINRCAALMRSMFLNNEIPTIICSANYYSQVVLLSKVEIKGQIKSPGLIFPDNYSNQVREDPVFQLGKIAGISSLIRDYYTGRVQVDNGRVMKARSLAFGAETWLLLKKMAEKEEIDLNFCSTQRKIMETFPRGLGSLRSTLNYSTPDYLPLNVRPDCFCRNN